MSRGICNDTERVFSLTETSGVVDWSELVGMKARIKSLTMQNGWRLPEGHPKEFTVADVGFRVTIDGKCHAIITLEGIEDRTFALKDLEFV